MTVGARIRAARKYRGLTQVQLSGLISIDQTTLSAWELCRPGRDKDGNETSSPEPRASQLLRLAEELNVDPLWIASGANPPEWLTAEDAA